MQFTSRWIGASMETREIAVGAGIEDVELSAFYLFLVAMFRSLCYGSLVLCQIKIPRMINGVGDARHKRSVHVANIFCRERIDRSAAYTCKSSSD